MLKSTGEIRLNTRVKSGGFCKLFLVGSNGSIMLKSMGEIMLKYILNLNFLATSNFLIYYTPTQIIFYGIMAFIFFYFSFSSSNYWFSCGWLNFHNKFLHKGLLVH